MNEEKKKEKVKPKYGMCSNTWFMIKNAWKVRKSVLAFCIIEAVLGIVLNLVGLYIGPTVLNTIEAKASITVMLQTILSMVMLMMLAAAANEYVQRNKMYGKIEVRTYMTTDRITKFCTTAYPNLWNQKFLKMDSNAERVLQDNYQASERIWETFQMLLRSIAGLIIYLLLLSTLDASIMLLVVVTTVISYFASKKIHTWGYMHRAEEAEYSRKLRYLNEKFESRAFAKDIRIFGMQEWLEEIYGKFYHLHHSFQVKKQKIYLWANVIDIVLTFARNGIAYAYLIHLTLQNHLSAANFLLYFGAVSGFTAWVGEILSGMEELHLQSNDLSQLREYIDMDEGFSLETGESLTVEPGKAYELELRNVSFTYPGAEKCILKDINLTIHPGEKVAVVGLNGAGKTTLVKLLCGLCDPTSGTVLLDGEDIRKYKRKDYYRLFSAVFQDFSVLAVTVAQNVAQRVEGVDEEKVWKCLEMAGLTEKIKSLPDGCDTYMCKEVHDNATEFSGGELQRLMLARALYKDGAVIVLDEPTAALDPIAENDIYMKYGELTKGRTSLFISHRLASTRFCDRILFIADGKIVEEGTHEELLKKGGQYAELFEVQSRYYREGGEADE